MRELSGVIIAAEIADFTRFATAPQMMGFTGLVPSEHSTGNDQKRFRITLTLNGDRGWQSVGGSVQELDKDRLDRNLARLSSHMAARGVVLRGI